MSQYVMMQEQKKLTWTGLETLNRYNVFQEMSQPDRNKGKDNDDYQ